ncbi:uncharacterized protein LOC111071177 [Drosophila obscura]|uniref:uncharacterized protein LOC111071177 n=1 Tax=Drosophila obscura TaxID=7282 RepID=UPI001BB1B177|nr:uncharacterized protein LOC111071177 [Drosophila obscura]
MMPSKSSKKGASDGNLLRSTDSDFALQLRSAPKLVCIPQQHQQHRQRLFNSEISIPLRPMEYEISDKSWSVLYIGAVKNKNKNLK